MLPSEPSATQVLRREHDPQETPDRGAVRRQRFAIWHLEPRPAYGEKRYRAGSQATSAFVIRLPRVARSRWRRGDRAGPVRLAPRRTIGIARAVRMGAGARAAAFVRGRRTNHRGSRLFVRLRQGEDSGASLSAAEDPLWPTEPLSRRQRKQPLSNSYKGFGLCDGLVRKQKCRELADTVVRVLLVRDWGSVGGARPRFRGRSLSGESDRAPPAERRDPLVAKPIARRAAAGGEKRSPAGSARDDCLPSNAIVRRRLLGRLLLGDSGSRPDSRCCLLTVPSGPRQLAPDQLAVGACEHPTVLRLGTGLASPATGPIIAARIGRAQG
jgi:hypothetical protein